MAPRSYELMNKDKVIACFKLDAMASEVMSFSCPDPSSLPIGFTDIHSFIESRKAPSNRAHIKEILAACGCLTTSGYLDVIRALGLNDTFWVRPSGSETSWSSVSLYENRFNETIARIAFEGGLFGQRLSTPSPEPSMGGSFAKCVLRRGGELVILKAGQQDAFGAGWEPWSEAMAWQVGTALGYDVVPYKMTFHRSKRNSQILPATTCPLFTSEETGFAPASSWMGRTAASYRSLLAAYEAIGAGQPFRNMVVLDALTLNVDRHLGNHGVLFDNDTLEVMGMAPIFDNNLSFCPGMTLGNPEKDFSRARELLRPRIGEDFNQVADAALTPKERKKVHELGDFEFDRSLLPKMPEERVAILEGFVHRQSQLLAGPVIEGRGFNLVPERPEEDLSWQLDDWPTEHELMDDVPEGADWVEPLSSQRNRSSTHVEGHEKMSVPHMDMRTDNR